MLAKSGVKFTSCKRLTVNRSLLQPLTPETVPADLEQKREFPPQQPAKPATLKLPAYFFDLDLCLIHQVQERDCPSTTSGEKPWEAAVDFCDGSGKRYKIFVRKETSFMIKSLRSLGVDIEFVTQNLSGAQIIQRLTEADWTTWHALPVTVVSEREPGSKRLENTQTFFKYLAEGEDVMTLKKRSLIVDDQALSWCREDKRFVTTVKPFDVVALETGIETSFNPEYLKMLFSDRLLKFFGETIRN